LQPLVENSKQGKGNGRYKDFIGSCCCFGSPFRYFLAFRSPSKPRSSSCPYQWRLHLSLSLFLYIYIFCRSDM